VVRRDAEDALFFLTLKFVIAHEVGHYVSGHIVDRALRFEHSGPAVYQPVDLRRHADELERWLTTHGKSTAAVTGAGHHAIMKAVGNALPAELRPRWNAQVDVIDSPAGRDYLDALDKLPD